MGRCAVIVTIDEGSWHLSISTKSALPTYTEMKQARYKFLPDEIYMAEIFPPKAEFVNAHEYCRHLWQIPHDSHERLTDRDRLNRLQALTTGYGKGWILRPSSKFAGMRLHESSRDGSDPDIRTALDKYFKDEKNS